MRSRENARTGHGTRVRFAWCAVACAALLGTSLTAGAAVREVTVLNTGTAHRDLYDMEMTASGHGLAVGGLGTILVTEDGGETWGFTHYPTRRALFGVAIAGDTTVISGQGGLILMRQGRDGQWQKIPSGTQQRLLSVDLNQAGFGVIVGTFGTLLRTTDGGKTWALANMNLAEHVEGYYNPHLNRVQVLADGAAVVVGEFGLVLRTSDKGATWTFARKAEKRNSSLYGLDIRDSGLGYAVGQQGVVLRTHDAGKTWNKVEVGSSGNFLGVCISDDGTITVPGMRHMVVSDDDGKSWTQVTAGDVNAMWYMDASCTDHGVLAVGHTTRVIRISKPGDSAADSQSAGDQIAASGPD